MKLKNNLWDNDEVLQVCLSKLEAENIVVPTDIVLYDNPTEGVYMFLGKINDNNIAFDFHYDDNKHDYIPCLTIDSNVILYNTCREMANNWHRHDMVQLKARLSK